MEENPKTKREIELLEKLKELPEFVWIPDFISLTGGAVYAKDRKPNDADLVIRSNDFDASLWLKLSRIANDRLGLMPHAVPSPFGPNWRHLPLFDLILRPKKELKFRDVDEMEFANGFYKQEERMSAEAQKEAKESLKENEIKMFRMFFPFKTTLDAVVARKVDSKYDVSELIKMIETEKIRFPLTAQKKYDGNRVIIFKEADKVKIVSEEGREVTDRLPATIDEIKQLSKENFILDSELERWRGDEHLPREDTAGYLHAKTEPDDSEVIINIFDCLYYDKDLHKEIQTERLKYLAKLNFKQSTIGIPDPKKSHLNLSPTFIIESEKDLEPDLRKLSDSPASEGAMIKFDEAYPLSGTGGNWLKFKKYGEVKAIVLKVNKTKVATIFNYEIGINFAKDDNIDPELILEIPAGKFHHIGRTYNTDVVVPVGGIVKIGFHTMNIYKDKVQQMHLYEPIFLEYLKDEKNPMSFKDAYNEGASKGLLEFKVEKVEEEEEFDIGTFDLAGQTSEILRDYWRKVLAWYSTLKEGEELKFTENQVEDFALRLMKEMIDRGDTNFHPDKMTENSKELFLKIINNLTEGKLLFLPAPHSEMLAKGTKKAIVKVKKLEPKIYNFGDADFIWGVLELKEPKEISLQEFKQTEPEHKVTEKEREDWWPEVDKFYLYQFNRVAVFDEPRKYERKPQAEVVQTNTFIRKAYYLRRLEKQKDEYLTYPDEDKTWKFVAQHHYRGKSSHTDLRLEISKDTLVGWTINDLIADQIKKPVETLTEGRSLDKDPGNWKINWNTGEFKEREVRGGQVRPAALRAQRKAPEPHVWLEVEGIAEPGEVGATKEYPGVFTIVDKGEVEFGTQKTYFHEYFMSGNKLKGRLVFRLLARSTEAKELREDGFSNEEVNLLMKIKNLLSIRTKIDKQILPPGIEEERPRELFFWVAMQPVDQTPYVLSPDAIKKKWSPPVGVSALPKKIKKNIPANLQYWKEKSEAKRVEMQKELSQMEELGVEVKKEETLDFVLQRHWWRGQIVIRFGPSTQHWDIRINGNRKKILHFVLERDPLENKTLTAYIKEDRDTKVWEMGIDKPEELKPGTDLNPTKDTPAWLSRLDAGKVVVFEDTDEFKKFQFKGKQLKGIWTFRREEKDSPFWVMEKSTEPMTKQVKFQKVDNEKQVVYGIVYEPYKVDTQDDFATPEEIEMACWIFMEDYRRYNLMHKEFSSKMKVVESYIAPSDFYLGDDLVRKGSWVLATHILDKEIWKKVKQGEFTGYSMEGFASKEIVSEVM